MIKNCPFCGSQPVFNNKVSHPRDVGFSYEESSVQVWISCENCGIEFSETKTYGSNSPNVSDISVLQTQLIQQWNTRHD